MVSSFGKVFEGLFRESTEFPVGISNLPSFSNTTSKLSRILSFSEVGSTVLHTLKLKIIVTTCSILELRVKLQSEKEKQILINRISQLIQTLFFKYTKQLINCLKNYVITVLNNTKYFVLLAG